MRIPLSAKLILLVVAFLIAATVIFAQQSSELFETVLVQREEYSNMLQAGSRAGEVERLITGAVDRMQVIGTLMVQKEVAKIERERDGETEAVRDDNDIFLNFYKDKGLISLEVLKVEGGKTTSIGRQVKDEFLETQGQTEGFIDRLRALQSFPLDEVRKNKIVIRNASYPKGYPLVTIGIPLIRDDQDQVHFIALGDLDFRYLQKLFSEESERALFVFDDGGNLITHQDERRALARHSLKGHPLVEKALTDEVTRRQIQYTDPETDSVMIGAFVRIANYGLTVVSQTPKSVILEPAFEVRRKAFFIAGTMISVAIFCIFLFSSSLTGPIEVLAQLVTLVSKGNFEIKAKDRIKFMFPDEVSDLAEAFDHMTDGLKERDKVKNLFSKFHGSSITEDLLQKDIGVGGQAKDVAVFFSDIRGFTAFSEMHAPEQVVEMLNEYFEVMVKIISDNHGVVDKFIGDAIMAVWGAPHSSGRDVQNAVKACLEMRQALNELNDKRIERGQQPLMIGMGLHAGTVISGTIGSHERMEYTIIGDTVNMASRIEASTKAFGADLLISESVRALVGDEFIVELAGAAEVKGKSEPLSLYKVKGFVDPQSGVPIEIRTPYSDYAAEKADKVKIAS